MCVCVCENITQLYEKVCVCENITQLYEKVIITVLFFCLLHNLYFCNFNI